MSGAGYGLEPAPRAALARSHNPPQRSKADVMRAWPAERRQRWLAGLTSEEAVALEYDWAFWARAAQLAPANRWLVWLVLAGRGWG